MSDVQPRMDLLGRIVDREGKGYLHRDEVDPHFKAEPVEKKPRKFLPRVGKKGRRDRRELARVKPALLERSGGLCEARVTELCTGVGTMPHHVVRRAQGGENDIDDLLWVDLHCHDFLHRNPELARTLGMIRSSERRR